MMKRKNGRLTSVQRGRLGEAVARRVLDNVRDVIYKTPEPNLKGFYSQPDPERPWNLTRDTATSELKWRRWQVAELLKAFEAYELAWVGFKGALLKTGGAKVFFTSWQKIVHCEAVALRILKRFDERIRLELD